VGADNGVQLSLYESDIKRDKWERIGQAVDPLRQRYGYMSVQRTLMLTDPKLGRINPKAGHTVPPVGYFGGQGKWKDGKRDMCRWSCVLTPPGI